MRKSKRVTVNHAVKASSKASAFVPVSIPEPALSGEALSLPVNFFTKLDILLAVAISLLSAAAFFPIMQGLVAAHRDYSAHAYFAQLLREQGTLLSPACLLHVFVAGLVELGLASSYKSALLGVVVCSHGAVAAVLYLCARWAFGTVDGILGRLVPAVVAILGPFVQPPVSWKATYSIGYLWAEPYYSPTYALSKPFALASAAFAAYFLVTTTKPSWRAISLCAVSVALGAIAKPSFMICALPAVVLCAAYRHVRKASFSLPGVLYGWVLPALSVLVWQYYRTYASIGTASQYGDSILFAPLAVMRYHTNDIAIPYLLSALLPLSVLLVYGRRAWADSGFRFSAIPFLFGTAYTYTLAEKLRFTAGNFLWSGYITLFVVYFFAVVFVLKQVTNSPPTVRALLPAAPCLAILVWQLTSGIAVHMNFIRLYD